MKTNKFFSLIRQVGSSMAMRRCRHLGTVLCARLLFLALASHAIFASAQTSIGAPFPIATGWATVGAAFDGTNYLVAMVTGSQMSSVAGQLISQNGTRVGSLIAVGDAGGACCNAVAFDGTNYLMVWENDLASSTRGTTSTFTAYGQFINTAGVALGQPVALTNADLWLDGVKFLAYGGGKYLLTYSKFEASAAGGSSSRYTTGRIIAPDGVLGNERRISTGTGTGSSIGFDGTNFLVVWTNGSEVRGRFVSPAGPLGQEFSINASPGASGPVQVAFDGTNYLVIFHDAVGAASTLDVYGQRVSPAGALVGGIITMSNDPGTQLAMGIAFDGTHYLTTWTDMQSSTNWVHGQFIGKDGTLVGSKIAINTDAGNQFGGVGGYANGKYFAFVNSGAQLGSNGLTMAGGAVSGSFVGTYRAPAPDPNQNVAPPPVTQTEYTVSTGLMPAEGVTTTATGTLDSATLRVTLDLSKVLGSFAGQGQFAADYNIYVAALVPSGVLGLPSATWFVYRFVYPPTPAWAELGSPIAAYMQGLAQNATNTVEIDILRNMDVTGLLGSEIYIGYGADDTEMLSKGRYRGVYKVR